MPEYPRGDYHRDPLHIADALDQIRRRLGKQEFEAPTGATTLPPAPTAFDLGFLVARLAEVAASAADESQVRSGFRGRNSHDQRAAVILTHATAQATEALLHLTAALEVAGQQHAAEENPYRPGPPPLHVHDRLHRHLARAHRQLTHTIGELRDDVTDQGYTYPHPTKRVRGITPVNHKPNAKPAVAAATPSSAPRLL
jgi:hypothetical protein